MQSTTGNHVSRIVIGATLMRRKPATAASVACAIGVAVMIAAAVPAAGDAIFDAVAGHVFFADVLRAAKLGITPLETAAFIEQRDDGSLVCELWPASHADHEASFRGAIPPGTVAIVHTHPLDWPLPSTHDTQESARLRIPIYVLTLRDVYKVIPHSSTPAAIVRDRLWMPESGDQTIEHCRPLRR
jgi:hypothetical protein